MGADIINHRNDAGPELRYLVNPSPCGIATRPGNSAFSRGMTVGLFYPAAQHQATVLRVPAGIRRRACGSLMAASASGRMPLDFPHYGHQSMRMFRELALIPAMLAGAFAASASDRGPVLPIAFRHAYLRVPLPAPTVADLCPVPQHPRIGRNQTKSFRNNFRGRISHSATISAIPSVCPRKWSPATSLSSGQHRPGFLLSLAAILAAGCVTR